MWLTGPVAPRHVGSSQTRAQTRVPCIGRQILNHCATREAPGLFLLLLLLSCMSCLYIFKINPLLVTSFANIFSLSLGYLFILFMVSFAVPKLISLVRSRLFIFFWLCWVFVSVRGPSPVAASGSHSSSRCAGLSLSRPLPLRSTGSRRSGSVVVAHRPSCSAACGIFPDQGSNPCPLHWQADSQPLRHQGSPINLLMTLRLLPYLTCCK